MSGGYTHTHTRSLTCGDISLRFFLFFRTTLLLSGRASMLFGSILLLQLVEFVWQSEQPVCGNLVIAPDCRHYHCVTHHRVQKPAE